MIYCISEYIENAKVFALAVMLRANADGYRLLSLAITGDGDAGIGPRRYIILFYWKNIIWFCLRTDIKVKFIIFHVTGCQPRTVSIIYFVI